MSTFQLSWTSEEIDILKALQKLIDYSVFPSKGGAPMDANYFLYQLHSVFHQKHTMNSPFFLEGQ